MRGPETSRRDPGRTLRCDEARILLMGYLDGELEPAEAARLEDHLAVCVECRREERAFRRLEEVTGEMAEEEVPPAEIRAAWDTIYARMERGIGWLLMSVGLIITLGYGAWRFLNGFLLDPAVPLIVRVGVGATTAGMVVLLVSIGRERWFMGRTERYREVQR